MKRRSFLAALVSAPAVAPVALREATAAAGVKPLGFGFAGENAVPSPSAPGSNLPWMVERLKELEAADAFDQYFANMDQPSRLDPDLASSRSLSLSAALLIQRRRDAQRALDRSRRSYMRDFRAEYGTEWQGIAAWLSRPLDKAKELFI